jgi:hypothetical protein
VDISTVLHLGLPVAMLLALAIGSNPRWLLPLPLFSAVFAGRLVGGYLRYLAATDPTRIGPMSNWQKFDIGLLTLALVCAVVGLIRLWRLPRVRPPDEAA